MILGFNRHDVVFIFNLWRANVDDRYLGSSFGAIWAILNPLIMFALFTFVFGFVFRARLPGSDSSFAYSIWLICGYGPWLANSEALLASATSVISNSGLVKNMAFKTELLPIATTMIGLVPLVVSVTFILSLQLVAGDGLLISLFWLPLVVLVHFIFLSAIGMMLSAVTTFVRDVGVVLPNLLLFLLFATPIFYPIGTMPKVVQQVTAFNPFYIISESYRAAIIGGHGVPVFALTALAVVSLGLLSFGLKIFRRVKSFFPMVL